jgi:antirestriction protein ArdC
MKKKHKENLKSLSLKVNAAIEATIDSQQFKDYLSTIAKFYQYSFHNQLLIASQKPNATRVAGFRAWQTNFNRQVQKGAKSIAIFGHPKKIEREVELDDGSKEIEERIWWPIVHVFDISDTKGDPLPDLDRTKIKDDSDHANRLIEMLINVVLENGIDYQEVDQIDGAYANTNALGAFSPAENMIQLVTGNGASKGELFKTLAHEIGHAFYENLFTRKHEGHSYASEECIVETSAMIVASRFGLDLAPYDVSYVAGWSKGDRKLYQSGLEKATQLASNIINKFIEIEGS